nr:hypothetical protein [Tanacetum cinerariifolium]
DDIQVEDQPHVDDASPTAESPLYIADSDSIGEDDDEDPEEDPKDTKEEELYEGSDETEPFEEDETAIIPPPPIHRRERISVRLQTPMAASTQALIDAFAAGLPLFLLPPTSPAYYQAPLAKSSTAARAPRGQYDFVDAVEARQGLIRSPGHDASNIARAADRAEDFGYVRALHASEHRMMTSIEERTAYKTELQEVRQAYLNFEAQNKALLARLETLEAHMSHMEWQRQSAEDLAVTQMLRIYVLEARAQTDMVEDTESCCVVGLSQWLEKMKSVFHISGCAIDNQVKFVTCTLLGLALMCTKFLADETKKVDKHISGLPDNIHGKVMSAYTGNLPLCAKCNYHHTRKCAPKCNNCMKYGHATHECRVNVNNNNNNRVQSTGTCFECGESRNFKKNCLKLKNNGNANGNGRAQGKAYVLGGGESNLETNTVTDNHYDVELDDGKIIGVNTILRGCTIDFLNHPFNINHMPVPLGSFDVIIGMDWLREYHAVIVCNKKIVRVPFGKKTFIFQDKRNNQVHESQLNIISCVKTHKYLSKGCDVFLAHVTTMEAKDKSEGKRLEDVPIVKDFHEDLSGIPPAREVEFQIDLVPGVAPVARVHYRLALAEMMKLADQLQECNTLNFQATLAEGSIGVTS